LQLVERSESRQALRTVVGYFHTGDLVERTIRLSGIAHQFRGIAIDLIEISAIGCNPAITRAAGDVSTERPGCAVARNLRTRGIARELQATPVDMEAADVAVAEVRRVYRLVIRGDCQPAQLGRQACARVDLHERADANRAVFLDGSHGAPVTDGISDDEGI